MKGPLAVVRHLVEAIPEDDRAQYINMGSKDLASTGMAALHAACYPTSPEGCVKFLLLNGADHEAAWDRGPECRPRRWTAAHIACYYTRLDAMRLLLKPNSDILGVLLQEGPRETARTCLQRACLSHNVEGVAWLLNNTKLEDIQKPHGKGWSVWECASFRVRSSRGRALERSSLMLLIELAVREKAENFDSRCRWQEWQKGQRSFAIWECIVSNIPSFVSFFGRLLRQRDISEPEFEFLMNELLQRWRGKSELPTRNPGCTVKLMPTRHKSDHRAETLPVGAVVKECTTVEPSGSASDLSSTKLRSDGLTSIHSSNNKRASVAGGRLGSPISIVFPWIDSEIFDSIRSWRDSTATQEYQVGLKYCHGMSSLRQFYHSLTLDEYCCQSLPKDALDRRNYDQVVLSLQYPEIDESESREEASNRHPLVTRLIVVQQAWIFSVKNVLLCSGAPVVLESELVSNAKDVLKGIGVMLVQLIRTADKTHYLSLNPDNIDHWHHFQGKLFEIFEQAIAAVSESVDTYLRVVNMDAIDLATEKECLHRIIDIQEELSMIRRIIQQQEEVWRAFGNKAWPDYWQDGRFHIPQGDWIDCNQEEKQEWETIMSPEIIFKAYYRRIAQLDEDAQRVERSVTLMLDLKSKHATMSEAHASAIMSAAVVGFTIVTIIFAPMSYMATLFALPLSTFQETQDPSRFSSESGAYRSGYFAKWTVTATFTTIIFTVLCMWFAIKSLRVSVFRPALRDLQNLGTKFAVELMDFWITEARHFSEKRRPISGRDSEPHHTDADNVGGARKKDNQEPKATRINRHMNRLLHRKKTTSTDEEKSH